MQKKKDNQCAAVKGVTWLMFFLDVYLKSLKQLFRAPIKHVIFKDLMFALIRKTVFDGIAKVPFSVPRDRLFTKKKDQKSVAICLEACVEQNY